VEEVKQMILITGAAGKTGRAVLKALSERGETVRVMVRRQEQVDEMIKLGASSGQVGDMVSAESYKDAMEGVRAVYHICPNMHPDEVKIGSFAIEAACRCGLEHFVYHSVLHPQTEKMPHHWNKMRVEELLFESGLRFTVLQPAPYMQNILAWKNKIISEGSFEVPYPVETKFSLVDLADLARAAAVVLTEPGHKEAVYEIVGTRALSQKELANLLGKVLERPILAEEIPREQWRQNAEKAGMGHYQVETLLKMFDYYTRFGLSGNRYVLKQLLGRDPHSFTGFVTREFENPQNSRC
jgi:NAD(P)H dehydrogenase (quinone)